MEKKRLYKSATDKKLAGVCGGIAEYFDIDSTIVRLAVVLISLAGTVGLWFYVIAAIVMPNPPQSSVDGGYTPYTDYVQHDD